MFGIGPTEMIFFLVILLLVVGPERLPTFMRAVGKGVRQIRNASREFKEAIGLDELMREGDPFRPQPVRPPRARPEPVAPESPEPEILSELAAEPPVAGTVPRTVPPPLPEVLGAPEAADSELEEARDPDSEAVPDSEASSKANFP